MHVFSFGEEEFGVPDPELGFSDERQVTLGELTDIGARFRYTYDFGDDWQHEITVEKLLDPDPDAHYPALVGAKGACPPEDCGGPWGYANLRKILADPSQDEPKTCSNGSASTTPPSSTPSPCPAKRSTTS